MREHMRARADAQRPIATKPSAGALVRGRGAHHRPQQRLAGRELTRAEGIDRLRKASLAELPERSSFHLPKLDHRTPELSDEAESDLFRSTLAEQDPSTVSDRQRRRIAERQALGRAVRTLAMQQ